MKAPKKSLSSKDAAKLGHLGGVKGGPARAKKLTSLEREIIAAKGGKAKAAKAAAKEKTSAAKKPSKKAK
jgi:hypothetical protein